MGASVALLVGGVGVMNVLRSGGTESDLRRRSLPPTVLWPRIQKIQDVILSQAADRAAGKLERVKIALAQIREKLPAA